MCVGHRDASTTCMIESEVIRLIGHQARLFLANKTCICYLGTNLSLPLPASMDGILGGIRLEYFLDGGVVDSWRLSG